MSQPQSSGMSSARTAMAIAIVGVVLGASGLGYAVYLGVFSVPNQFSTFPSINQPHQTWNVTLDWVSTYDSGQDRFAPEYITIAQGDTVNLRFISNDTDDGHTFTMKLPTGIFQLNNSVIGQVNVLTQPETTFTTSAANCSDQNGSPVTCQTTGGCFDSTGAPTACPGGPNSTAMLTAKGSFTVTAAGLYRFRCLYHEKFGMFGFLVVLPNTST